MDIHVPVIFYQTVQSRKNFESQSDWYWTFKFNNDIGPTYILVAIVFKSLACLFTWINLTDLMSASRHMRQIHVYS